MQRVRKQIGIPEKGFENGGTGVTIAVLDTGVGYHPDLNKRVVCFQDFVGTKSMPYDDNGHGTHVCGIICGSGQLSSGVYRGIAPGARLVVGKVLDKNGDGSTKDMLRGLEWVREIKDIYNIRILNISVGIGSLDEKKKEKALYDRISELWDCGIVVVCAAGNKGPANDTISSVGGCSKVITVGCHDGQFYANNPKRCETYSGRGRAGSMIRKPDLVAPGTDIKSCNTNYNKKYGNIGNAYVMKSGTSMATPIVSGACALLLQIYPQLSNDACKETLLYSATDMNLPWNQQGWGMLCLKELLKINTE